MSDETELLDFSDNGDLLDISVPIKEPVMAKPFSADFQDYSHTGGLGTSNFPGPDIKSDLPAFTQSTATVPVQNRVINTSATFYSIDYYRTFFNVSTAQILKRLSKAVVPLPGNPFYREEDTENNKPDLYGPFWICTTVIISMAAAGNLGSYFTEPQKQEWQTDFELMTMAASVFYFSISVAPFLLYLALSRVGLDKSLVEVVSIYGYSLTVYVPASIICIAPLEFVRWIVLVWCFLVSTWFIVKNLFPTDPDLRKRTAVLMIGVILYHAALAFITKVYFFSYKK